jgi:hypothetical protein
MERSVDPELTVATAAIGALRYEALLSCCVEYIQAKLVGLTCCTCRSNMSATGGQRVCERMISEHCLDIAISVLIKVLPSLSPSLPRSLR